MFGVLFKYEQVKGHVINCKTTDFLVLHEHLHQCVTLQVFTVSHQVSVMFSILVNFSSDSCVKNFLVQIVRVTISDE